MLIKKLTFGSYQELLHFLHENTLEQFAVLRHSEAEIELSYICFEEDQPTTA